MNRRDLLLLRADPDRHVADLSCERLYMHYQQTRFMSDGPGDSRTPDSRTPWSGPDDAEPPAVFTERTTHELFGAVGRELRGADVVRVHDTGWLADDAFRRDVDALLAAFRRRGGRVEYPASRAP